MFPTLAAAVFDVDATDTDTSRRCNLIGSYKLHVSTTALKLLSSGGDTVLYEWPYM